jgi:hypothetical protein
MVLMKMEKKDGSVIRNGQSIVDIESQKNFEQQFKSKDTLIDFFMKSPFPDLDLSVTRDKDMGRVWETET